jgi:DNA mismatch repair protein MutL
VEKNIRLLPPEEARKIAAGEVVDRPSALVREFLDNAIDAGARQIELVIEEGGIRRTEVIDDGCGMEKEDLELCWLPHATSKIRCLDDLKTVNTLGFRGEALAAAAAVSRLEILSSRDGREAWKLVLSPGGKPSLEQSRRTKGTSVRSLELYDNIPARKRFLKRAGSEAASCRQIFNEKALAFPDLTFRFTQDGVLKSLLTQTGSLKERFGQIFVDERERHFLHEIFDQGRQGSGFSVSIVAGGPELCRRERRLQFAFANSRRIQDFALLQALEYGLEGFFPGGSHPVGAVFVNIDPSLADFNIHPAKREARFVELGAIHQTVVSALKDFTRRFFTSSSFMNGAAETVVKHEKISLFDYHGVSVNHDNAYSAGRTSALSDRLAMEALLSHPPDFAPLPGRDSWAAEEAAVYTAGKAHYLGRLFGLFILIEKEDRFFIIDQHAAHERILYDRLIGTPLPKQELLVTIPFNTESAEDDRFLEEKQKELAELGIDIRRETVSHSYGISTNGGWLIEALPAGWKLSINETIAEILNLKTAKENLAERWTAALACHTAVKDGDFLDEKTALALAEEAFALPVRRCPHGRPIWFELDKDDLLKAVKRL